MSGRKPPGASWESWVDQLIRESRERGEFDDLKGAGKPIPGLDKPHDEMWWVRKKLESEGVSYLPPNLALRKEKEDIFERLPSQRSESRVRQILEELNARIREVNRRPQDGPTVMPFDVEAVVEQWREARTAQAEAAAAAAAPAAPAAPAAQPAPRAQRRWRRRSA
jgi:hypothetical protein